MPANVILSDKVEKELVKEGAAIDFVRSAFSHIKSIAGDQGGQMILKKANFGQDADIVDVNDNTVFIASARMCQWDQEKTSLAI